MARCQVVCPEAPQELRAERETLGWSSQGRLSGERASGVALPAKG